MYIYCIYFPAFSCHLLLKFESQVPLNIFVCVAFVCSEIRLQYNSYLWAIHHTPNWFGPSDAVSLKYSHRQQRSVAYEKLRGVLVWCFMKKHFNIKALQNESKEILKEAVHPWTTLMLCGCYKWYRSIFLIYWSSCFTHVFFETKGEKLGRDLSITEKLKATNMLSHIACHALEEFSMASVNMQ